MSQTTATAEDLKERRKSAAGSILRWTQDEIVNAPEEHVKVLGDNLALSLVRNKLAQSANNGDKLTPDVLYSLDNSRLDNLHMAALQDPASAEGRNIASAHSIVVSKYLTLEHSMINSDMIQYTHSSGGPTTQSVRQDRNTSAHYIQGLLADLRTGTQAQQDVASEPMLVALGKALKEVEATGEQISASIVLALENNSNQKHFLAHSPYIRDTAGESDAYFTAQSETYRALATQCKQRGLVHGVAAEVARSRG